MRHTPVLFLAALAAIGCDKPLPDAYGTFEATEITLSSEASGRLLAVHAVEGTAVTRATLLAVVDTVPLVLQRREILANRFAMLAQAAETDAQLRVIDVQRSVAQRTFDRTARLIAASAATAQQSDAATRDLRTLEAQAEGARAAREKVGRDLAGFDAQLAVLDDRLRRSRVVAPSDGTILARYVEPGELVMPGSPVAKIAALDSLVLRAYVAEAQLSQVKLGAAVQVKVDAGAGALRTIPGRVTWVASSAEFTPTPIQTRSERVTQVYAVKVQVPNADGALKIGMPGELWLPGAVK